MASVLTMSNSRRARKASCLSSPMSTLKETVKACTFGPPALPSALAPDASKGVGCRTTSYFLVVGPFISFVVVGLTCSHLVAGGGSLGFRCFGGTSLWRKASKLGGKNWAVAFAFAVVVASGFDFPSAVSFLF